MVIVREISGGRQGAMAARDGGRTTIRSGMNNVLWTVAVLVGPLVLGCKGSGFPTFVKFDPQSRFLLAQDGRWPTVHVYDLRTRRRHIFSGRVVCVSRDVTRFVLRRGGWQDWRDMVVVDLSGQNPSVRAVPPLPEHPYSPTYVIRFTGPADGLRAVVLAHRYHDPPAACYAITMGEDAWRAQPVTEGDGNMRTQQSCPPGIRDTGHVYLHTPPDPPGPGARFEWGADVESVFDGERSSFRLPSPDGKWVVTVHDPADLWRRTTLLEASTQRRLVLIDRDDAAYDVFSTLVGLPGGLLLVLMGANF